VHLVGFYYKNYHDARSSECQILIGNKLSKPDRRTIPTHAGRSQKNQATLHLTQKISRLKIRTQDLPNKRLELYQRPSCTTKANMTWISHNSRGTCAYLLRCKWKDSITAVSDGAEWEAFYRVGTREVLLWTRQWNFGFHKRWAISSVPETLSVLQKETFFVLNFFCAKLSLYNIQKFN